MGLSLALATQLTDALARQLGTAFLIHQRLEASAPLAITFQPAMGVAERNPGSLRLAQGGFLAGPVIAFGNIARRFPVAAAGVGHGLGIDAVELRIGTL